MKELEDKLSHAVLAEATPAHQARMRALFDEVQTPPRLVNRPVALWKCAAACAVCVGLGFVLSGLRAPESAVRTPPSPVLTAHPAVPSAEQHGPGEAEEHLSTKPWPRRIVVGEIINRSDGWIEATLEEAP
ncbi:MAG: hypothetical protein HYV27_23200 [Candidatus Hydrogenedentes bacterium]|nr:hypothetical protein [Candidatus Hydrogenedentota bacterium]